MEKTLTQPRVRIGRTEMDFPHQGRVLKAVHPFYGPANSLNLLRQIRGSPENQTGLVEPTSAELASFVHEYLNGDGPQAREVSRIMKERFFTGFTGIRKYFRGFTGILYLPKERVAHFIDYPNFNGDSFVDRDDLLKRLGESRAQVSFEHLKQGHVNWKDVGNHPYFVAWAGGKEGAEKLAELASKHPKKEAFMFVPNVLDLEESTAGVAALYSYWASDSLYVDSSYRGDDVDSYAFGVLKETSEAGSQKI